MSERDPLLSRSAESDPNGKLTRRIDVPVSETLDDSIGAVALMLGYGSKAEYVRSVMQREMFGTLAVMRAKLPDARRG